MFFVLVALIFLSNLVSGVTIDPAVPLSTLRTYVSEFKQLAKEELDRLFNIYRAQSPQTWGLRGKSFLYENYGLLLAVSAPVPGELLTIVDVGGSTTCYDLELLIWIRLTSNSEIVSGTANPGHPRKASDKHSNDPLPPCHWTYLVPHSLTPDLYTLSVKLLSVDGGLDFANQKCHAVEGGSYPSILPHLQVFSPKFYGGRISCCEVCTRLPWCEAWMFPSLPREGVVYDKGKDQYPEKTCELFAKDAKILFDPVKDMSIRNKTQQEQDGQNPYFAGVSRKEKTMHFLGCGWSVQYYLTPCLDEGRDDMPTMMKRQMIVVKPTEKDNPTPPATSEKPLCDLKGMSRGRWVATPPSISCSYELDHKVYNSARFYKFKHIASQPEECWIHENFGILTSTCAEGGCGGYQQGIWFSELRPDKIDKTSDVSKLLTKGATFKYTWQSYDDCKSPLYTDDQIVSIFNNTFARPILEGASLKEAFFNYVEQRFSVLDDKIQYGHRKFLASTLAFPHRLWNLSNEQFIAFLEDQHTRKKGDVLIYMPGPFYSSEREDHVTQRRAEVFTEIARPILTRKGWIEVEWFSISQAISFDSAGQNDGLHVAGPPMKQLFQQIMRVAELEKERTD
jgi:hypothetical protein